MGATISSERTTCEGGGSLSDVLIYYRSTPVQRPRAPSRGSRFTDLWARLHAALAAGAGRAAERSVKSLVVFGASTPNTPGSADKTIKLFNVNDGAALRTFTHHEKAVRSLALLPDGLRFVSGSDDKTARIVEIGLAPL